MRRAGGAFEVRWLLATIGLVAAGSMAFVAIVTAPAPCVPAPVPQGTVAAAAVAIAPSAPSVLAGGEGGRGGGAGGLPAPDATTLATGVPRPVDAEERGGPSDGPTPALPRDPSGRRDALDPLRREVFAGLAELRWRIAHCDVSGAGVLVTLESLEGGVRIAAVRLEALTPDGDPRAHTEATWVNEDALRCARSALERNVIGAPCAAPGRRWEMPFEPGPVE
jgi:hypothetical protein